MSGVNLADEWLKLVFFVKILLNKFTIINILAKIWLFFGRLKGVFGGDFWSFWWFLLGFGFIIGIITIFV